MTVIAWDGKTLAADRMAVWSGMQATVSKIRRIETGEILAWSGSQDCGLILADWYECGADPTKWPDFQKDKDDWTRLIIARKDGIHCYEQHLIPLRFDNLFLAWGSGRDYAMGAMAMGADAIKAVQIASQFDTGCGNGVEHFTP